MPRKKKEVAPEYHVTVRLTTKCDCKCAHCCFECGPNRSDIMPVEVVKQIKGCFSGHVTWLNVMGGELTLLPDYPDLLNELTFAPMRIVTNGTWVNKEEEKKRFLSTIRELSQGDHHVLVSISRDKLHPKGVGEKAYEWLKSKKTSKDFWFTSATQDLKEEERAIAPVGRAHFNLLGDGFFRMFGARCRCNENEKSMAVLEDGSVTYCQFGAWPMGHLTDGFNELRKVHKRMDKIFIPSCNSCWQSWELSGRQRWSKEKETHDTKVGNDE